MALLESLLGIRGKLDAYSEAAKVATMQRLGVDDYYTKLLQAQETARGQVQNKLATEAEQRQLQTQAGLLKPILSKYGPDAAKQIGSLLLSNSPEARAYGAAQLGDAEVRRGTAPQSLLQSLQAGQLANTAAAQGITQQGIMGPLQVERERAGIAASNASTAASQYALRQQQLADAAPKPVLPYGEPPKGRFPVQNPQGEIEYIPQPGTEAYNTATEAVRTQENLVRDLQLFQTSVVKAGASGTEMVGDLANTLRFQRGNVLSGLAKLRNLGVLQPGEYEILADQLPDPTGFIRNIGGAVAAFEPTGIVADAMREAIQAPYDQFRKLAEDRLRQSYKTYWYVQPVPGTLPETAR